MSQLKKGTGSEQADDSLANTMAARCLSPFFNALS